jgi:hypothetical protein
MRVLSIAYYAELVGLGAQRLRRAAERLSLAGEPMPRLVQLSRGRGTVRIRGPYGRLVVLDQDAQIAAAQLDQAGQAVTAATADDGADSRGTRRANQEMVLKIAA